MDAKIKVSPGDMIEMPGSQINDMRRPGRRVNESYKVLEVYPCFVLCQKIWGGYRECFTWRQLRAGQLKERDVK